ncbi:unnamed protein product [Urochloa humidicola]
MSDDEAYDADGDVGRFLHCPSPEAHLVFQPEGTLGGIFQYAPPAHVPAAPPRTLNPAPESSGVQAPDFGLEAPAAAIYGDAEHDEAAPVTDDAEDHHQLPGGMMDVDHQYQEMAMDVQPPHMQMPQGYGGFPDPTLLVQGDDDGVHGEHYYQMPIMGNQHHPAPRTMNNFVRHHDAPHIMDAEHHQDQEPIMDAEHYSAAAIVDGDHHHQVPAIDDDGEAMAMDVVQPTAHMMTAQETQQGYGGGGDAVHYDAPPVNAYQYEKMAMDVIVPPAPTQMPQANGGFPNPTPPMHQSGSGGVDAAAAAAPWLEGSSSMFSDPPSPTMCRMLDELADMLQGIEGGGGDDDVAGGAEVAVEGGGDNAVVGGGGAEIAEGVGGDAAASGGAEASESDDDSEEEDVGPADEEIKFKPITHGQLDCSRCHFVREVLAIDWPSKIHFAVHSTYPETFEHAVTHRMLMGQDGQFHTYALLYMDLRGRQNEWVENFIAKSVDMMKRRNAGTVLDTNDPGTSNNAALVVHGHMDLEAGMLNDLLSAATATTGESKHLTDYLLFISSICIYILRTQNYGIVMTLLLHEAASSEAAVQPPMSQEEQVNTDALSVAQAAAPEAAEPAVTQAQQVPEVAATATSRAESRPHDALDKFPPFNWEGFKPDILESSQVEPYDPASGVNVLMYPSMLEQLQMEELKKKESKKLSKMTVEDTPEYLNINDEHFANAPNFASATFKLLCQKDPTYRMFKRRVSGLNRKIKKLEQGANRVGTGGLFKIKQKMETCKQEKKELYDVIKRGMEELENERRNDNAGPSNHAAGPSSNSSPGPSNGAGPSNVASTSSNDTSPSNVSGNSNSGAGPSSVAGPSSNVAGPSGTK